MCVPNPKAGSAMVSSRQGDIIVEDVVRVPVLLQGRQARQLPAAIDLLESLIALRVADVDSVIVVAARLGQAGTELATEVSHSPGCRALCVLPAKEADAMGGRYLVSVR